MVINSYSIDFSLFVQTNNIGLPIFSAYQNDLEIRTDNVAEQNYGTNINHQVKC